MERRILHSDCNCFYAAVEMLHHPEYEGLPLAVGGSPEKRHGIILTANYIAKRSGVKTGMALWQAEQVCPDIIFVPPRMDLYLRFSALANEIYAEYSDQREPFGIDETWIDVTASSSCKGDAQHIAEEISSRIKKELGITVSIGISWNKIFAKFGSDYKKPDAITEITRDNYKDIIWTSPVKDLLCVGTATNRKLHTYGINTIGDLAYTDSSFLERLLGKPGLLLQTFARGEDETPVSFEEANAPIKSIGNSTTTPRDLTTLDDVRIIIYLLAESVATRLKRAGLAGRVIAIHVRDSELHTFSMQQKISIPTNLSDEIAAQAFELFLSSCASTPTTSIPASSHNTGATRRTFSSLSANALSAQRPESIPNVYSVLNFDLERNIKPIQNIEPIRSIGVRAMDLVPDTCSYQTDLFTDECLREKRSSLDRTVMEIRSRFGYTSVQRGLMYLDKKLSSLDATDDRHMVHPHAYIPDKPRR